MTTAPPTRTPTPTPPTPTDSPNPWVAEHIRRFEETGGQPRPGIRDLLLTTRGRRSGTLRRTALAYVREADAVGSLADAPTNAPATTPATIPTTAPAGAPADTDAAGAYVLTASNAGAAHHPAWYLNLTADPAVTLQVGTETFPALARPATPAEAERLWPVVVASMPSYAAYRDAAEGAAGRAVPLVLVTRTGGAPEAG